MIDIDNILKEVDYKRLRDAYYFINLISNRHCIPNDVLLKNYHAYCEEFDKLNKRTSSEVNE